MKCRTTVCKELQLITGKRKKALCVWEGERGRLFVCFWVCEADLQVQVTCSLSQAQWTEVLTAEKNDEDILHCYFALSSLTTSEQNTHTYTSLAVLLSNYSVNCSYNSSSYFNSGPFVLRIERLVKSKILKLLICFTGILHLHLLQNEELKRFTLEWHN